MANGPDFVQQSQSGEVRLLQGRQRIRRDPGAFRLFRDLIGVRLFPVEHNKQQDPEEIRFGQVIGQPQLRKEHGRVGEGEEGTHRREMEPSETHCEGQ